MAGIFPIPDKLLVAIGGNAIHPVDIEGTSAEQQAIAGRTAEALLPLSSAGPWRKRQAAVSGTWFRHLSRGMFATSPWSRSWPGAARSSSPAATFR